MNNFKKILGIDLKTSIIDYLKVGSLALIFALVVTLIIGRDNSWPNFGILLTLFEMLIVIAGLPIFMASSISKTLPIGKKLGVSRGEIAKAFIIKDLIMTVVAMLVLGLLTVFVANPILADASAHPGFLEFYEMIGLNDLGRLLFYIFSLTAYSVLTSCFTLEENEGALAGSIYGTVVFLSMFVFTFRKPIPKFIYILTIASYIVGTLLRTHIIKKTDN